MSFSEVQQGDDTIVRIDGLLDACSAVDLRPLLE